jgi:hypothetical protein
MIWQHVPNDTSSVYIYGIQPWCSRLILFLSDIGHVHLMVLSAYFSNYVYLACHTQKTSALYELVKGSYARDDLGLSARLSRFMRTAPHGF